MLVRAEEKGAGMKRLLGLFVGRLDTWWHCYRKNADLEAFGYECVCMCARIVEDVGITHDIILKCGSVSFMISISFLFSTVYKVFID